MEGKSSREAGLAAFGDFKNLERDLDAYLDKNRMVALRIPANRLRNQAIAVRPLRPGEAAIMPVRIRSSRGITADMADGLLAEARAVASRFPDDAAVLAALTEAEHDAGNDAEAIKAADAALAIDRTQVNAYVQKGLSLFRLAGKADDQPAAYALARAPFTALNRLENDHPLPLYYYYLSFVRQNRPPSPLAVQGLARAAQLAPFDLGLKMTFADQQLRAGQRAAARRILIPVAYNPHGGGLASLAQRAINKLDGEPLWDTSRGLSALEETPSVTP